MPKMSGLFGNVMGAKKYKRVDMGERMEFYYNEELRRYVERGKEHEVSQEIAPPPPPKRTKKSSQQDPVVPGAPSTKLSTPGSGGITSRYAALPGVKAVYPTSSAKISSLACTSANRNSRSPAKVATFVPKILLDKDAHISNPDGGTNHGKQQENRCQAVVRSGSYQACRMISPEQSLESLSTSPRHAAFSPCPMSPTNGQTFPFATPANIPHSSLKTGASQSSSLSPRVQPIPFNPYAGLGVHASNSFVSPSQLSQVHEQQVADYQCGSSTSQKSDNAHWADVLPSSAEGQPVGCAKYGMDPPDALDGTALQHAALGMQGYVYTSADAWDMAGIRKHVPVELVATSVDSEVLRGANTSTLAGLPHPNEIPSPWVAYDYSLWDADLWERLSTFDAELYYYHYVQFTLHQGWSSADWEMYNAEYPEHYEYVDYYCHEWQTEKGTPTLPLPRTGLPLASGGFVTNEWLQAAQDTVGDSSAVDYETSVRAAVDSTPSVFVMQGDALGCTSLLKVPAAADTPGKISSSVELQEIERVNPSDHAGFNVTHGDRCSMGGFARISGAAPSSTDGNDVTEAAVQGGSCADLANIHNECIRTSNSEGLAADINSAMHNLQHAPSLSANALVAAQTPLEMRETFQSSHQPVGYVHILSKCGAVSLLPKGTARSAARAVVLPEKSTATSRTGMDVSQPDHSLMTMPTEPDQQHWAKDPRFMPFAMSPSPELDPDEADVWPDAEALRAAVAFYAAEMRDDSVAASDDDNKYRELDDGNSGSHTTSTSPSERTTGGESIQTGSSIVSSIGHGVAGCTGQGFGVASGGADIDDALHRQSSAGGAVDEDEDDGDEEDGFGDVRSVAAVASPSSCKRREHEASIPTGPLSTAAATADADAALQHLEATLEKSQAEQAQRANAAVSAVGDVGVVYAPSIILSDAHSEAPSSMIVNAPSEAIMEEGDMGGSTTGFSELPNIPEVGVPDASDELDAPVLPPMHGEVPTTTRPEINISDLEGWGMCVPRGAHTASCAAEAASTEAASDKGSETHDVEDTPCTSAVANTGSVSAAHRSAVAVGTVSAPAGPSTSTGLLSPSAEGSDGNGGRESVVKRLLQELGRMNALLGSASTTDMMPLGIVDQLRMVQSANDAMLDAMKEHKPLAVQLEAIATEPSAATVPGTPLRTDTGSMTPVRTPGIHSDMSTPDLHQLTAGSTAIQQPLSSGPSSLHAAFGGSHANTLFSGTLPPESGQSAPRASTASADAVEALQAELAVCNAAAEGLWKALESSQMETGKLQAALVAAEGVGADALKQATAAAEAREHAEVELAALQDVRKRMLDQLQETEAANASLKEQVETAEGAKATAHTYAQGQIAAAVAARTSAESLRQEASAARAELEAARAENKSLQDGAERSASALNSAEAAHAAAVGSLSTARTDIAVLHQSLLRVQQANTELQHQFQNARVRAENTEMHANTVAEDASQELAAMQAQVQELDGDVYEGMCALGVESDRVAALVDALVSVGVDPSPILNGVENEHLEAAAAGGVGIEDESALGSTSVIHFDSAVSSAALLAGDAKQAACDNLCNAADPAASSAHGRSLGDSRGSGLSVSRGSHALMETSTDQQFGEGHGDPGEFGSLGLLTGAAVWDSIGGAVWGDDPSTAQVAGGSTNVEQLPHQQQDVPKNAVPAVFAAGTKQEELPAPQVTQQPEPTLQQQCHEVSRTETALPVLQEHTQESNKEWDAWGNGADDLSGVACSPSSSHRQVLPAALANAQQGAFCSHSRGVAAHDRHGGWEPKSGTARHVAQSKQQESDAVVTDPSLDHNAAPGDHVASDDAVSELGWNQGWDVASLPQCPIGMIIASCNGVPQVGGESDVLEASNSPEAASDDWCRREEDGIIPSGWDPLCGHHSDMNVGGWGGNDCAAEDGAATPLPTVACAATVGAGWGADAWTGSMKEPSTLSGGATAETAHGRTEPSAGGFFDSLPILIPEGVHMTAPHAAESVQDGTADNDQSNGSATVATAGGAHASGFVAQDDAPIYSQHQHCEHTQQGYVHCEQQHGDANQGCGGLGANSQSGCVGGSGNEWMATHSEQHSTHQQGDLFASYSEGEVEHDGDVRGQNWVAENVRLGVAHCPNGWSTGDEEVWNGGAWNNVAGAQDLAACTQDVAYGWKEDGSWGASGAWDISAIAPADSAQYAGAPAYDQQQNTAQQHNEDQITAWDAYQEHIHTSGWQT